MSLPSSRRGLLVMASLCSVMVGGCGGAPSYPGVTFVEASEATSEQLHATCEYLAVVPTGTFMEAGAAASQRGGNVVMPLGGSETRETAVSSYSSGGTTYQTHLETWSSSTYVAIFDCGS